MDLAHFSPRKKKEGRGNGVNKLDLWPNKQKRNTFIYYWSVHLYSLHNHKNIYTQKYTNPLLECVLDGRQEYILYIHSNSVGKDCMAVVGNDRAIISHSLSFATH